MVRLLKADVHGVMDQLEDKGLLLKQQLREMEQALSQKDKQLNQMIASRNRLKQAHEKYQNETEKLEQDIESAIKGGKDDLARTMIKRVRSVAGHRDELDRSIKRMEGQIDQFEDRLRQQRLCYEQIKHRSEEYFYQADQNAWEASSPNIFTDRFANRLTDRHTDRIFQDPDSEAIELELLRRKETVRGGEAS
jgi:phage shock protein A